MKLALVTPWFGREVKGGAEQQAWQIATRLAARRHHVEVLTTCCRSHQDDWATNHLPAGIAPEKEGFSIRRFPVSARDRRAFDRVCANLLALNPASLKPGVSPASPEDSAIFAQELIKSPEMLTYLETHRSDYDWFLFLPYLYGPILQGIHLVGDRAVLQPCLHDEAYAYLPEVARAFYHAAKLFFNSDGELELALQLFGPGIWRKSYMVGEGIESAIAAERPRPDKSNGSPASPEKKRFLLYLGRKDAGKNVPLLLTAFERFRAVRPNSKLGLILAGPGPGSALPSEVADYGVVSEQEKNALLRDCLALVQPSQNESFSRVMMEAWLHGKPVAVHAGCLATAIPVKKTKGGWVADSEHDWARLFVEIDRAADRELATRGENGRRYAAEVADWDLVIDRYAAALVIDSAEPSTPIASTPAARTAINQFLPNLTYGDAISNEAIWIRDQLRAAGFASDIYVQFVDPRVAQECQIFAPAALSGSDAAIYHHSIGAAMTPHLIEFAGPKYLIYHNITPGEYFERFRPEFARILHQGREDLARLANSFENSVGDSAFNATELAHCGFRDPGILPLAIEPGKWAFEPDPGLLDQMEDGRTNILFVGRFAPNKKQDDLLRAFSHYLEYDPDARLILAGKPEQADPYVDYIQSLIAELGVSSSVLQPGSIHDAQLAAYYRSAHLFWSMSEHEGFCVPLIEAMWFDIPIFAFKASAVPETLGGAGFMFTAKENWAELAATAHLLVTDKALREKLLGAQRIRRLDFLPEKVRPILLEIAKKLAPLPKQKRANRRSNKPA